MAPIWASNSLLSVWAPDTMTTSLVKRTDVWFREIIIEQLFACQELEQVPGARCQVLGGRGTPVFSVPLS